MTKHITGFGTWHDLPCRAGPALDDATFERLSTYLKQDCSVSDQELSVIKANLMRCESNPLDDEQLWIQLQHGPIHTLMSTFKQEWQRRRSQFVASIAVSDCTTETAQDSEQMVCRPCSGACVSIKASYSWQCTVYFVDRIEGHSNNDFSCYKHQTHLTIGF